MSQDIPSELDGILGHLMLLHPASRGDMKQKLHALLEDRQPEVIDSHNTHSVIFTFTAGNNRYGLKIEYGPAIVTRDEAHWYELAPDSLKTHHVVSHIADTYAFVLLRWLEKAQTIEQIAVAGEGNSDNPTIELVIGALEQNKTLFESSPTVSLLSGPETGYFYDKYRAYNAAAKDYPFLQRLLDSRELRVNGRVLPGPERFVRAVQRDGRLREYLSPHRAGLIHGDLHMDNLLVEDGKVYFIDPKGVDHLPLEYDTGRVMWSLSGWNAIVNGEFTLASDDDGYHLDIVRRRQYVEGIPRLREYFSEQEYHRALYSSAMQYLTRVSHAAIEPEATALYLRGIEQFAELFDELGQKA